MAPEFGFLVCVSILLSSDPRHLRNWRPWFQTLAGDLTGSWLVVMCYFVDAWMWVVTGYRAAVSLSIT